MRFGKFLFVFVALAALAACSTNPATGKQQFAGLMSPQQELGVGASEHQKISVQYGFYNNPRLQSYVNEVGKRVTAQTERPDVVYKFFVLDSPIVNAFALPGGYIYISRGLLALANNEAELAAVLAHETGHVTARHAAERYSHGVLTTLGAAVISAAVDRSGVTQALGMGSDLYLSSYSRTQEEEADSLGLRYMTRGGYDPIAMPAFLASLQRDSALEAREAGHGQNFSYFSTHPATGERVASTISGAKRYPPGGKVNRDEYMNMIDGLIYGDSEKQGFVRGQNFYHTEQGFAFSIPAGFKIMNHAEQVAAVSPSGAVILFDTAPNTANMSPTDYMARGWMKGAAGATQNVIVNGINGVAASFDGHVNGRPMTIGLFALPWQGKFVRFQVAIPKGAIDCVDDCANLEWVPFSFHPLSESERASLHPERVNLVTAKNGDTVKSLAAAQPFGASNEEKFRVLNALAPAGSIQPGQRYKVVVE